MIKLFKLLGVIFVWTVLLTNSYSCVGPDGTPDYFGLLSEDDEKKPATSETKPLEEKEPAIVSIFKLVRGNSDRQIEIPIPSERILEIGNGTFIAENETNIGPKYSASENFKILNSSSEKIEIDLPNQIGPFFITSINSLKQTLAPKEFAIINVAFYPSNEFISEPGKATHEVEIGNSKYDLVGLALGSTGRITMNILDNKGNIEKNNANILTFSEIALSAHPLRRFFQCTSIKCGDQNLLTNCHPCIDVIQGTCELLTINKNGEPIEAVDENCKPITKDKNPASDINLASSDIMPTKGFKKIIEIINSGVDILKIDSININDILDSKSKHEFSVNTTAIFKADSFKEIQDLVIPAFEANEHIQGIELPIELPPFNPPTTTTRLFLVIAYEPKDIIGRNGMEAAVGSSTKDEALLTITSTESQTELMLAGSTTVREIPALQLYIKTSSGIRPIANEDTLPFKDITFNTENLSVPMFMKTSDAAIKPLRIASINMTGTNFEWLNTADLINSKPEESRCTLPIYDDTGSQVNFETNLQPVSLNPNGFRLDPAAHTLDTMPFFGCINFTRDIKESAQTRMFRAKMVVKAQELTSSGQPTINPDGSTKEMSYAFTILGVIEPIKGQLVLRLTQTMSAVLNKDMPGISAAASADEVDMLISEGIGSESDKSIFVMPIHLDPFDEEFIFSPDGKLTSSPNDDITAVFYPIDTRAIPETYNNPMLEDYTSLLYDSLLPEGQRGIFEGYPNVPDDFRAHALKIYTSTLSYPGPRAAPEEIANSVQDCERIDPCTAEGQRKLGEGPSNPAKYKGVCTFFHITVGAFESKAFHYETENNPGNRRPMCEDRTTPYSLNPIKGKYFLDGKMEFENIGMLFQGPTFFHNPSGELGQKPPLDELLHLTFTTEILLPKSEVKNIDRIPDRRIDLSKGEYKINLNDQYSSLPAICNSNKKNRLVAGKKYSTWKYLAPLLKKDKEGTVPAGCPEEDNNFLGGIAYLSGKRLDHETGHATLITAAKFSSSEDLTFAFKDVMLFIVLNGWFCDPLGSEDDMEGTHCYDKTFNYRDADTQYSIVK